MFEAAMFVLMISFPDSLMNGVFTHIWFKYNVYIEHLGFIDVFNPFEIWLDWVCM